MYWGLFFLFISFDLGALDRFNWYVSDSFLLASLHAAAGDEEGAGALLPAGPDHAGEAPLESKDSDSDERMVRRQRGEEKKCVCVRASVCIGKDNKRPGVFILEGDSLRVR